MIPISFKFWNFNKYEFQTDISINCNGTYNYTGDDLLIPLQNTNYKDSYGNNIFIGDILHLNGVYHIVYYSDGTLMLTNYGTLNEWFCKYAVNIGNIFESNIEAIKTDIDNIKSILLQNSK